MVMKTKQIEGTQWQSIKGDYHGMIKNTASGPTLILDGTSVLKLTKKNNYAISYLKKT